MEKKFDDNYGKIGTVKVEYTVPNEAPAINDSVQPLEEGAVSPFNP